jgi:hypothetical protein
LRAPTNAWSACVGLSWRRLLGVVRPGARWDLRKRTGGIGAERVRRAAVVGNRELGGVDAGLLEGAGDLGQCQPSDLGFLWLSPV